MHQLQRKLHNIYLIYKDLYPEEYIQVVEQIKIARSSMIDGDLGTLTDKSGAIERMVGEMPEKLYNLITIKLTAEELKDFSSKKAVRSFYKRHPEFCLIKDL